MNPQFLTGERLFGDDLSPQEILTWYQEEANAYTDIYSPVIDEHEYRQWVDRYGFSRIHSSISFNHVLGFGSGLGSELIPHQHRMHRITILESSSVYQAHSPELDVPTTFLQANPTGLIDLASSSVDLVVCQGVLHHIPNVTTIVSEFSRILRPGGWAIIREPIISMGDWTKPRQGLTKNERGIPPRILEGAAATGGLALASREYVSFPIVRHLAKGLRVSRPYNRRLWTTMDHALCALTRFNYSYHANSGFKRLRPTACIWVFQRSM